MSLLHDLTRDDQTSRENKCVLKTPFLQNLLVQMVHIRPDIALIVVVITSLYLINGSQNGLICNTLTVVPSVLITFIVRDLHPMSLSLIRNVLIFWTLLGITVPVDYVCHQVSGYFAFKFIILEATLFCVLKKIIAFVDWSSLPKVARTPAPKIDHEKQMPMYHKQSFPLYGDNLSQTFHPATSLSTGIEGGDGDCTCEKLPLVLKEDNPEVLSSVSTIETLVQLLAHDLPKLEVFSNNNVTLSKNKRSCIVELQNKGSCNLMWLMKTNSNNYIVAMPTKGILKQDQSCKVVLQVRGKLKKEARKPKVVFEYIPVTSKWFCFKKNLMDKYKDEKQKEFLSIEVR
ncbi:unnamed protein product [Bursaphelenchus okinawaensis]|uniref:MSP domain-containing protein n=1 Tax=Bursaphelenchus okinawaensis TaxID=465554 RepID=A0A811KWH6_9BILA|nr:unnamed protein product [Bursaphelenchus okinawaensis]CAG9112894.1 unnamed protein product [Bursaphelenchus okinawaensis]